MNEVNEVKEEKKEYVTPKMEVVEMECDTTLLAGSGDENWWDDKPESVCNHGHNPHCSIFD